MGCNGDGVARVDAGARWAPPDRVDAAKGPSCEGRLVALRRVVGVGVGVGVPGQIQVQGPRHRIRAATLDCDATPDCARSDAEAVAVSTEARDTRHETRDTRHCNAVLKIRTAGTRPTKARPPASDGRDGRGHDLGIDGWWMVCLGTAEQALI